MSLLRVSIKHHGRVHTHHENASRFSLSFMQEALQAVSELSETYKGEASKGVV